jgi:pSer/pThr/pTyr-binding forkhead associated (FHA) protein
MLILNGELAGQRFPLGEFTRIGRSLDNSITLTDGQVSRKHAAIQKIGSAYLLMDNGSANGTYINEKRITDRAHLRPGDVVRIGNTRMRIELFDS